MPRLYILAGVKLLYTIKRPENGSIESKFSVFFVQKRPFSNEKSSTQTNGSYLYKN